MNSNSDLLSRTLESFPRDLLSSYFGEDGIKEEIIKSILKKFKASDIENFIVEFFNLLHLSIKVFEINKSIPSSVKDLMHSKKIFHLANKKYSEWVYLFRTEIQYYNKNTGNDDILEFYIPVKIINQGKKLIIYQNIFSKDISKYFKDKIYIDRRSNPEGKIIEEIKTNIGQHPYPLDLNKGIKELWKNDYIDARDVKNRNAKSFDQVRMDQQFLYKKAYPKEWKALMATPLQKTNYKSISTQIKVDHFYCDATNGELQISYFSNEKSDVPDLLNEILKHNK